jgi:myxalamid-type nonribosomal peptide synthetase MxaA
MTNGGRTLELDCEPADVQESLCCHVQGPSRCWSVSALVDLMAAAWADHLQLPFAFSVRLIELPRADQASRLRLSLDSASQESTLSYQCRDRPHEWLVCMSARLQSNRLRPMDGYRDSELQSDSEVPARDTLQRLGLEPERRVVERIQIQPTRNTLRLWLCPDVQRDSAHYCLQPVVIQAALQAVALLAPDCGAIPHIERAVVGRRGDMPDSVVIRYDTACGHAYITLLDSHAAAIGQLEVRVAQPTDVSHRSRGSLADLVAFAEVALAKTYLPSENLIAAGATSLDLVRLLAAIQEASQTSVPIVAFLAEPTLLHLHDLIVHAHPGPLTGSAHRLETVLAREPATSAQAQPLTAMQRALWLASRKPAAELAYLESVAWRITGPLDVCALRNAWLHLGERYESFRSTIVESASDLTQTVLPASRAHFDYQQLVTEESCSDLHVAILSWIERETCRTFERGEPLARARLARISQDDHLLLITAHHAMCDGTSMHNHVAPELASSYHRAPHHHGATGLLQPRHLARWESETVSTAELERVVSAWTHELANATAVELPTDRPVSAMPTQRVGRYTFEIPAALATRLRALAQHEQKSMFVLMFAAFRILLYRWTGGCDASIGTPIALGWSPRFQSTAGCFVDFVPIRTRVNGQTDLRALLRVVEAQVAAALDRQQVPFQRVLEQLSDHDRPSLATLASIAFVYEATMAVLQLAGLHVQPIACDNGYGKSELLLRTEVTTGTLRISFDYSRDRFDAETITQLAERYRRLLNHMDQAASTPLMAWPWLGHDERQQLLSYARGPSIAGARHATQVIAAVAAKHPHALAAEDGTRTLTFSALDLLASAGAARLRSLGVAKGQFVATYLHTGLDWLVAVLSAWKCGAAFIPLDPAQPYARTRELLDQAQLPVVLTTRALCVEFEPPAPQLIAVDELIAAERSESAQLTDADIAYGIFTSGSTGVPKLALTDHAGLANLALAFLTTFRLGTGARVLQFASPTVDASIPEMMLALASGATLVAASPAARHDGRALAELLSEQRIEVASLTPSVVASLPECALPDLRYLMLIGERCPTELVERWATRCRVFNLYGPAETSVWATYDRCEAGADRVTIGRPIANVNAYILDRDLNLAPIGQPGEICIGGVGVGPGYLNAPGLTELRFVPDPHADRPGARLYRTGDRGVLQTDGRIVFLGRNDDQIKLRGQRLELGEVEVALRSLRGVESAVVVVIAAETPDAKLCAFVRSVRSEIASGPVLRNALRQRLPAHMVPTSVTVLEDWPLLASGKIDRRALAQRVPVAEQISAEDQPRSGLEQSVAAAMAQVLGLDPSSISRHDDFFALGGHSLRVMALAQALARHTGADVGVAELLRSRSVRDVATHIESVAQAQLPLTTACMQRDQALRDDIRPGAFHTATWHTVLLTGATGFFGGQLLAELLRRTTALIVCPTRASTETQARQRVLMTLAERAPDLIAESGRIRALPSQLDAPRLGLSDVEYTMLSTEVDVILHVAALVNFALPYAALRPVNVEATRTLIELACQNRAKQLHYVSSLSVLFPRRDAAAPMLLETLGPDPALLTMGYGQSKAVSERLLLTVAERGACVRIYRPSRICPSGGASPNHSDDLLMRFLRGCVQLGRFPDTEAIDNLIPVDVAARLLLDIALRPELPHNIYHLANPHGTPVRAFTEALSALGHAQEFMACAPWCALRGAPELAPVQEFLRTTGLLEHGVPPIDMQNTSAYADVAQCPLVDTAWLQQQLPRWV